MSETDTFPTDDEDRSETTPRRTRGDVADTGVGFTSSPTLKPTTMALGATVFFTAVVAGVLIANPTLLGTVEITEIVLWVITLIGAFVSVRLLVKMYILSRMTYTVSEDGVSREYSLLFRYRRREMPLRMVRGVEVSRDPIETALGYGTVSILSGGTNQSLGFVKFEHVPEPERVTDAIERHQESETVTQR